jgi:uncharacterized membrane protein YfcA
MPPLPDALLALAILLLAALCQGFFGFGFGIVAMGGLTLSHDLIQASGLVNITGIVVMAWLTYGLRRHILRGLALRMLAPMLLGVFFGVLALGRVDRGLMVSILGATIVIVAVWNLLQPSLRTRESPWLDTVMALLGGLLSGAFNTGGPPLIIHLYRRPESPEVIKATLQSLLLIMIVSRLPLAAAHGLLSGPIWAEAALMIPFVIAGVGAGLVLARRVSPERFRRACWIALGLLGIGLLVAG